MKDEFDFRETEQRLIREFRTEGQVDGQTIKGIDLSLPMLKMRPIELEPIPLPKREV